MSARESTVFFNCRVCFSFLESKTTALKHLKNFHPNHYERLSERTLVNNDIQLSLSYLEFSLVQPIVVVEKIGSNLTYQPNSVGSISVLEASKSSQVGRRSKSKAKSRIKSQIENDLENVDNLRKGYHVPRVKDDVVEDFVPQSRKEKYVKRLSRSNAQLKQEGYQECSICKRVYKTSNFDYHLRRHRNAESLELKNNSTKEGLKNHVHTCKLCLKNYKTDKQLLDHLEAHGSLPLSYTCLECNSSQTSIAYLLFHMRVNHPHIFEDSVSKDINDGRVQNKERKQSKINCEKCHKDFAGMSLYKKHLLYHARIDNFKASKTFHCPICDKYFKLKDSLQRHQRFHMTDNPLVCKFPGCNKRFDANYKLRRHIALHYSNERYQCEECPANYSRQARLTEHIAQYHSTARKNASTKPLSIKKNWHRVVKANEVMDRLNAGDSSLTKVTKAEKLDEDEEGVKIHSVELPSIDLDDRSIINESGESVHIKGEQIEVSTFENRETQDCEMANTNRDVGLSDKLKSKLAIIKQIAIVKDQLSGPFFDQNEYNAGVLKFKCDDCGMAYRRSWMLRMHIKASHDRIPLDTPSTSSSQSNISKVLENGPSSENISFLCGKCGFLAKSSDDLDHHVKTAPQHGEKYSCDVCGLGFKTVQRLDSHKIRAHYSEKEHKCSHCGKQFVRKENLTLHLQKAHENIDEFRKKIDCNICSKSFSKSYFSKHMASIHPEYTVDGKNKSKRAMQKAVLEQPVCKLCNDKFSTVTSLRRHIQLVHLGKPVPMWVNGKKTFSSGTIRNRLLPDSERNDKNQNILDSGTILGI